MWWVIKTNSYDNLFKFLIITVIICLFSGFTVSATDITGPTTINQSGYYSVVNDIFFPIGDKSDCISIKADHVTLDGNGHTIFGTPANISVDSNDGIYVSSEYVEIRNITIKGFSSLDPENRAAIRVENHNVNMRHVNLSDNDIGSCANPEWDNIVMRNSILNNNSYGVYSLAYASNAGGYVIYHDNKFVKNRIDGLFLSRGRNSTVYSNEFIDNYYGICINTYDNTIYDNIIKDNEKSGIIISNVDRLNFIYNNSIYSNSEGIRLSSSSQANISNNIISTNLDTGLYISESEKCSIKNNRITDNSKGILVSYSSNNNLSNNYFNNVKNVDIIDENSINVWNVTKSTGPNIINGPYLGGSYWANPSGSGYSQTCTDSNGDGFCDVPYSIPDGNGDADYLPLHITGTVHTITATAGVGGSIFPSGNVSVSDGGSQIFTITPDNCYSIQDVLVNGVSQGPVSSYPFNNVTSDQTISASFVLNTYTINATSGPNGSISPAGATKVVCGSSQIYNITPNTGYTIEDVKVDGNSQGAISTYPFNNVKADHSISATFIPESVSHTIYATAGTGGSISPSGNVTVKDGENKTFTITPDNCYSIQDVLVDGASQGPISSYPFPKVVSDHTISASFVLNTYTINATSGPNGSISPAGATKVGCGGSQIYNITPNTGYKIEDVKVDGNSQGAISTYPFYNVTADHSIYATFIPEPVSHTIYATAGTGGSISPSGNVTVKDGENKTFTITPDNCYSIQDVLVDGVSQGPISSYPFPKVVSDHTISASFTKQEYSITATAGIGGTITPSGNVIVKCGEIITFSIAPDTNYEIESVIVDGVNKGVIRSYTFPEVHENHVISVSFQKLGGTYIINASADSHTIAYPYGIKTYNEGDNKTYLTQAKPGSDLLDVLVDKESKGSGESWTFTNITSDHNISTFGSYTPGQVQVFFSISPNWGQAPLTVQFTDQSVGSPTSYYWQFGDGSISTEKNPIHTYQIPGVYTVTLRGTNSQSGGVGVWNNAVTVTEGVIPQPTPTPEPGKITAAFTGSPVSGSAPLSVSFQDMSTGNPTSWTWVFGDGQISTLQNPVHHYTKSGKYSVILFAQNKRYSGSIQKTNYIVVN